MSSQHRNYVITLSSLIVSMVVLTGAFNRLVDPYGLWYDPLFEGWNNEKVAQDGNARLFKAVAVTRLRPNTIFLGTSRTEFGMNPAHPALVADGMVYNLGITGASIHEIRAYLEHALFINPRLKRAIIGLDFFSFSTSTNGDIRSGFEPARLSRDGMLPKDWLGALFSLDALAASWEVVKASRTDPGSTPYTPLGALTAVGRIRELKQKPLPQKMRQSLRLYLESDRRLNGYELSGAALNELRAIVQLSRWHGVELLAYISPTHVAHLEAIRTVGLQSVFEDWKRQIVHIVGQVWDFSGYNAVTSEPISANMKNYWDISHYRSSVGDMILTRMLVGAETVSRDFGYLVSRDNVENWLVAVRVQGDSWRAKDRQVQNMVHEILGRSSGFSLHRKQQ